MASYNPGTYEGTGRGYGGKLIVNVTVSENRIESVKVTQHKEYRGIAWGLNTTPMERFPKLIVEYQSLNIPTVDGADLTCAAILDATAAALKAAGVSKEDIAALKAAPGPKAPEYSDEVRTVDVVVCGAGAGGLAAAIEAKLAGADDFIRRLPQGYDTLIGEGGVYLSGGEEQRVSVARAILKNAPILILDEATAYADPENEFQMQLALQELIKNKTVLIIAHRLMTIRNANKIMVINHGKIEETGTHDQLLANERTYHKMWAAYTASSDWELKKGTDKEVAKA